MGSRVERVEPPPPAGARRRPRVTDDRHLRFIRLLPCVICGASGTEAAHLRTGNRLVGKRPTGMGERPSDCWTTPLCRTHHAKQHAGPELLFWYGYGINPFQLALALFAASGDLALAETIIAEHRMLAGGGT